MFGLVNVTCWVQVKSVVLDARGRQISHIQLVKSAADQKSIQTVSLVK